MEPKAIVTLSGTDKYYLAEKTEYNGINYFLATRVDDNEELLEESCYFEEIEANDMFYLDKVTDPELGKRLSNIFVKKVIIELDEA